MAFLFDTDAISEVLKPRPRAAYLRWLSGIPRAEQFTSAVVVGELYEGAFRSPNRDRHLANIESKVLPSVTVLPFDTECARVFGEVLAGLLGRGLTLMDADVQIAATAIRHGLSLVTGNLKHFSRIPGLALEGILAP